ncbi:MAG: hypothetical protein ACP5OP_06480 [Leptospirillia bacterium]
MGDIISDLKEGTRRLVLLVPVVAVPMEDGRDEWCFAPQESHRREMARLAALFEQWESESLPVMRASHPHREAEIRELFRIVRSKILLNNSNRHFLGYIPRGGKVEEGRSFYLTTFERTFDHLTGLLSDVTKPGLSGETSGRTKGS